MSHIHSIQPMNIGHNQASGGHPPGKPPGGGGRRPGDGHYVEVSIHYSQPILRLDECTNST